MKKNIIVSLIVYPIIAIGTFCLCFFVRGNYALTGWADALFFSGVFVALAGLLTILSFFGAFDFMIYGFRSVFKHMNRNYTNSQDKYPDYYAYSEGKKAKRKKEGIFIWIWLILALLLIAAGLIIDGLTR
ncbi:MAG: DUF3899 domain-containing protein [Candidatus Enteromonas sp.]